MHGPHFRRVNFPKFSQLIFIIIQNKDCSICFEEMGEFNMRILEPCEHRLTYHLKDLLVEFYKISQEISFHLGILNISVSFEIAL